MASTLESFPTLFSLLVLGPAPPRVPLSYLIRTLQISSSPQVFHSFVLCSRFYQTPSGFCGRFISSLEKAIILFPILYKDAEIVSDAYC